MNAYMVMHNYCIYYDLLLLAERKLIKFVRVVDSSGKAPAPRNLLLGMQRGCSSGVWASG